MGIPSIYQALTPQMRQALAARTPGVGPTGGQVMAGAGAAAPPQMPLAMAPAPGPNMPMPGSAPAPSAPPPAAAPPQMQMMAPTAPPSPDQSLMMAAGAAPMNAAAAAGQQGGGWFERMMGDPMLMFGLGTMAAAGRPGSNAFGSIAQGAMGAMQMARGTEEYQTQREERQRIREQRRAEKTAAEQLAASYEAQGKKDEAAFVRANPEVATKVMAQRMAPDRLALKDRFVMGQEGVGYVLDPNTGMPIAPITPSMFGGGGGSPSTPRIDLSPIDSVISRVERLLGGGA